MMKKTIEEYYEECNVCGKRISGDEIQVKHNMSVHKMIHNKKKKDEKPGCFCS